MLAELQAGLTPALAELIHRFLPLRLQQVAVAVLAGIVPQHLVAVLVVALLGQVQQVLELAVKDMQGVLVMFQRLIMMAVAVVEPLLSVQQQQLLMRGMAAQV